ncbi:hypothetical protein GCM10008096_26170 [Zhihengliuella salsuginis]|uniref:DUF885 domain-containing protein n=1 Tax=Zhihengliuella salsuginis TaxID=578222 RepID=A0ABQ3GKF7_9MICC|nr:hypothetical protein GCM10008096_26170 [Zhihengliuella salsuginis]
MAAAVGQEVETALAAYGVDPYSDIGSEWHYLYYRNALHSGRFSVTSMTGLRPFMSRELVRLSRSERAPYSKPTKADLSVINEMLLLLSPDAAAFEFDDRAKNMDHDFVRTRVRELGGPIGLGEIPEYRTYGDPASVNSGFAQPLARLVSDVGLWHRATREQLTEACRDGFDGITVPEIREAYEPVLREAEAKLGDEGLSFMQMRGSVGKLLTLGLANS